MATKHLSKVRTFVGAEGARFPCPRRSYQASLKQAVLSPHYYGSLEIDQHREPSTLWYPHQNDAAKTFIGAVCPSGAPAHAGGSGAYAELLRHTKTDWALGDQKAFEGLLRRVFVPAIQNFATFANGNWGTGCIKTLLACGVFLDDRALFDKAVAYYKNGSGNGRLTHYLINGPASARRVGRTSSMSSWG